MAVVVASASSCRPSFDARAPITLPPRPLMNVADTGATFTALAILASDAVIASVSAAGHGSPSAPVSRCSHVRTVAALIVQRSLPEVTTMSPTIRSAAAFATSASTSPWAGGISIVGASTTTSDGASSVPTTSSAAAVALAASNVRPALAGVVSIDVGVIVTVLSTGARSWAATAASILAARAVLSNEKRGAIETPWIARRTSATARSMSVPDRPVRSASSIMASISARRAKSAYGMATSPAVVRTTTRPSPRCPNAPVSALVAPARSSPDRSTPPTLTPGSTRPSRLASWASRLPPAMSRHRTNPTTNAIATRGQSRRRPASGAASGVTTSVTVAMRYASCTLAVTTTHPRHRCVIRSGDVIRPEVSDAT